MGLLATEVLPGIVVVIAIAMQVAERTDSFWPTSLQSWLTVVGVALGAAAAMWKWLLAPLRAEDKKHRGELARLAQFQHNISGEVNMLGMTLQGVVASRDTLQRDLGRLESEVNSLAQDARRESDLRNEQHAAVMQLLGDISGQLRVMLQPRGRQ
jgi:hypothetical protein